MRHISYSQYLDKVYGCFIGKAISGNMGAPHEGVKMPLELEFMPEMINCDLPNDDLDLQVIWLEVAEKLGEHFTSRDLLQRFVETCHYSPGEYAIMRKNFHRGIFPPVSGRFCNDFYMEGMGCPIRSEVWACAAPGNMTLASEFASRDGQLDHYGESIWAERFLAALESEAFFESDVRVLIEKALSVLPKDSKFRELVLYVQELCERYQDMKVVLTKILFRYGHPDCTNMYQNMGITIAALLLGENDIIKTSLLALNCGFDTDCTCATAGAVIGLLRGADELIRAYGLTEITYTLGVDIKRRSDKILDLAEDIAKLGIQFTKTCNSDIIIDDAPAVHFDFAPLPALQLTAEYENMDPSITLGGKRKVTLHLKNNTAETYSLRCTVGTEHSVVCDTPVFPLQLRPFETAAVPVTFSLPADAKLIYDKNTITVKAETADGALVLNDYFGLAGAATYKLSGPFWRTEPVCNTQLILEHFSDNHPYSALINDSKIPGNKTDKIRHFHLNFAVDTETLHLPMDAFFAPLPEDWASPVYEQTLVSIPQDSFSLRDFLPFRGPCSAYLSRIVVAPEDMDAYIQIGHSAPFRLYLNDEIVAERDYCDTWTAENVHIGPLPLKKGENRLLMRMTKVNEDAKYNITFSKGITMTENIVDLASKNPHQF